MNTHIETLCRQYPAINEMLRMYGGKTLEEYLGQLRHKSLPEILPSEDLLDGVITYLTPIFGKETALKTADTIRRNRCISTANHHHIAFDYRIVQETILYDRWLRISGDERGNVPVFAVSNVNLKNVLYPRGIIIYDCNLPEKRLRLPVFPGKMKCCCVAGMKGVQPDMVKTVQTRLLKEKNAGNISARMFDTVSEFCENILLSDRVQNYGTFREQATVINEMMSGKYFADRTPRYLWIDLETITAGLFIKDIGNENSIPFQILFCPQIRRLLLKNLEGISGCWTGNTGGTHFFWGIDEKAILYPMYLTHQNDTLMLTGENSMGRHVEIPFTPGSLCENLKTRKIIPGMFLIFLEIYFLRDFTVLGGYYQPTYLSMMQKGLVRTFEEMNAFKSEAEILRQKSNFVSLGPIYLTGNRETGPFPVSSAELMGCQLSTSELDEKFKIPLLQSFENLVF